MILKEALLDQCNIFVRNKMATIETIMAENRSALEQESKSSAGDKHETGRAMLHLEMEKASQQLSVAKQMKETLDKLQLNSVSEKIRLGSLIHTDLGVYFLSISVGEIVIEDKSYYAISPSSPIGALLIGKQKGEKVQFGTKVIKVLSID